MEITHSVLFSLFMRDNEWKVQFNISHAPSSGLSGIYFTILNVWSHWSRRTRKNITMRWSRGDFFIAATQHRTPACSFFHKSLITIFSKAFIVHPNMTLYTKRKHLTISDLRFNTTWDKIVNKFSVVCDITLKPVILIQ